MVRVQEGDSGYRGGLDRGVSGLFLQDFCCSSLAFEGYTSLSMMAIEYALGEGVDMIPLTMILR